MEAMTCPTCSAALTPASWWPHQARLHCPRTDFACRDCAELPDLLAHTLLQGHCPIPRPSKSLTSFPSSCLQSPEDASSAQPEAIPSPAVSEQGRDVEELTMLVHAGAGLSPALPVAVLKKDELDSEADSLEDSLRIKPEDTDEDLPNSPPPSLEAETFSGHKRKHSNRSSARATKSRGEQQEADGTCAPPKLEESFATADTANASKTNSAPELDVSAFKRIELRCTKCSSVLRTAFKTRMYVARDHVRACRDIHPFACSLCGHTAPIKYAISKRHFQRFCSGAEVVTREDYYTTATAQALRDCFPQLSTEKKQRENRYNEMNCRTCDVPVQYTTAVRRREVGLSHGLSCCQLRPFVCSNCGYSSVKLYLVQKHIRSACEGAAVVLNEECDEEAVRTVIGLCFPQLAGEVGLSMLKEQLQ